MFIHPLNKVLYLGVAIRFRTYVVIWPTVDVVALEEESNLVVSDQEVCPLPPDQSVCVQGELAASTILGRMGERIPKRKTKSKRTDIIFLTLTIYQIIKLPSSTCRVSPCRSIDSFIVVNPLNG